jgi:hypothetical protein
MGLFRPQIWSIIGKTVKQDQYPGTCIEFQFFFPSVRLFPKISTIKIVRYQELREEVLKKFERGFYKCSVIGRAPIIVKVMNAAS